MNWLARRVRSTHRNRVMFNNRCVERTLQKYAILLDNDKMFKQIFREAGGVLRLHSFDINYPDRLVISDNHESLIIVRTQVYRAG